jgi:hypothetical protein
VFEHRAAPLISRADFLWRLAGHGGYAALLLGVSMAAGTAGFHYWAGQSAIDALLNAAMLLGGMGPVGEIQSTAGKLFATCFALYAGIVFLGVTALLFAPVLHRFLHKFHLEENDGV